mgnify:CR=1 FL=1|jgi:hypothetical protein
MPMDLRSEIPVEIHDHNSSPNLPQKKRHFENVVGLSMASYVQIVPVRAMALLTVAFAVGFC